MPSKKRSSSPVCMDPMTMRLRIVMSPIVNGWNRFGYVRSRSCLRCRGDGLRCVGGDLGVEGDDDLVAPGDEALFDPYAALQDEPLVQAASPVAVAGVRSVSANRRYRVSRS